MVTIKVSIDLDFDKKPDSDLEKLVIGGIERWLETCKDAEFIDGYLLKQS